MQPKFYDNKQLNWLSLLIKVKNFVWGRLCKIQTILSSFYFHIRGWEQKKHKWIQIKKHLDLFCSHLSVCNSTRLYIQLRPCICHVFTIQWQILKILNTLWSVWNNQGFNKMSREWIISFNPYPAELKVKVIAISIEPGQPVHPCSLTMLYIVGWLPSYSHLDIPKMIGDSSKNGRLRNSAG